MTELYVESQERLTALCERARVAGRFGIDVEFIRERTFYPQLALVQIAVDDECVLIDPLGDLDLAPLDVLIGDANVLKILHAPKQDLEIFYYRTGAAPQSIFDTQLAAALIGLGNQVSYGTLIERVVGTTLKKGESFTDWLNRPLTSGQEQYALDDVRYLLEAHDLLVEKLESLGRGRWAAEEFDRFADISLYEPDPALLYQKVRRFGTLDPRGQAILRELAIWRDGEARKRDRPRRSVVSDEALVEVARARVDTVAKLERVRGLHPREAKRSHAAMIAAVASGLAVPKQDCPREERRPRLAPETELMVDFAQSFLKAECQAAHVAPSMVSNAAGVQTLVRQYLDGSHTSSGLPLMTGWRYDLIGQKIVDFLDGRVSVRMDPANHRPIFEHQR